MNRETLREWHRKYTDQASPMTPCPTDLSRDTSTYDPYLAAEHRGERWGLHVAAREYRRGFEDGVLTALVCVVIGAAVVVVVAWWFAR